MIKKILLYGLLCIGIISIVGCALNKAPQKRLYLLNYEPEQLENRLNASPYPFTIRIRQFNIDEAYDRSQIVYRKNAFEMGYYYYRIWAIKPTAMVADLIHNHFETVNLVRHVVRRLDEGFRPDYELRGTIEALEEYDSEEVWFAHFAIRMKLVRLADEKIVYSKSFNKRKQLSHHTPKQVVKELSRMLDYFMSEAITEIDKVLLNEYKTQIKTQQK